MIIIPTHSIIANRGEEILTRKTEWTPYTPRKGEWERNALLEAELQLKLLLLEPINSIYNCNVTVGREADINITISCLQQFFSKQSLLIAASHA